MTKLLGVEVEVVAILVTGLLAGAYLLSSVLCPTAKVDPARQEWLKVYPADEKPTTPRGFKTAGKGQGTTGWRVSGKRLLTAIVVLILTFQLAARALAELASFDGKDGRRLYIGAKGKVFDVGFLYRGWEAYGPRGGYAVFSGADASWALANMSLEPQDKWPAGVTWDSLGADEQKTLNDWVDKFENAYSYPVVGWIVDGFLPCSSL